MPRIGSFTSSKSLSVAGFVPANTSARAAAYIGTYGPSNGVYIPGEIVIGTKNSAPSGGVERIYVFRGKNSLGNVVATWIPDSVMEFFYVSPATMISSGYGNNALMAASAFSTVPPNWSDGAGVRDLINTNGVVTVEVSWSGMSAPFIINLTTT